jgi:uncharacterized protein (DUF305 family)
MIVERFRGVAVTAAVALLATGCVAPAPAPPAQAPNVVQAGAPGEPTRPVGAQAAHPGHTAADVDFMRHMIAHHQQAVEMSALVELRSANPEIRLLARRIEMAQADEMALMRRWLRERGEELSDHAHHGHHGPDAHAGMPGMLSAAQMARLGAARGAEFDRLFLEAMIFHHEGALRMVEELFATAGAGQEPEIYQFASHVDGDQRIEISRMYRMLAALPHP